MTRPAPSAALLARLARRFPNSPGHAAWRAAQLGEPMPEQDPQPAPAVPAAKSKPIRTGYPAVCSFG